MRWKAAVLGARRRVRRTPPGSESGAWLQRGNAGTWESHWSPGRRARHGGPGAHRPWRVRGASTRTRARTGDHKRPGARQGSGRERHATQPARDRMAVVASQSPEEGGEVRPKRPTGGKATSGRACSGLTHERDSALTKRVTTPPWHCWRGSRKLCLRNRMRSWRTYGSVGGPDG
jgi:hypothetical protein